MGLFSKGKQANEAIDRMHDDLGNVTFAVSVEHKIRTKKGGKHANVDFVSFYAVFSKLILLIPFLTFTIVRVFFPESDLWQVQYELFYDFENIKWGLFGSAFKIAFYSFIGTVLLNLLLGLLVCIRYGFFFLFFYFFAISFEQAVRTSFMFSALYLFSRFTS